MLFQPDVIGAYLDWRTQEVGIAAASSGDGALMNDYAAGDIYRALARLCGLTNEPDPIRWKNQNRPMRDRMKPLQLGINYGMGVPSLARGLNRHPLIASAIIERHLFPQDGKRACGRRYGAGEPSVGGDRWRDRPVTARPRPPVARKTALSWGDVWQSFALPLIVSPFQHVASPRLPRTMPAAPGQGAAGRSRLDSRDQA
jgi:hypothetical protein